MKPKDVEMLSDYDSGEDWHLRSRGALVFVSALGSLSVGRCPRGHQQFVYAQKHPGTLLVPFHVVESRPRVLMRREKRFNYPTSALFVMGGFVDSGDSDARFGGSRELWEESGVKVEKERLVPMSPVEYASNRSFDDLVSGRGNLAFAVELTPTEVADIEHASSDVDFVSLEDASRTPDALGKAALLDFVMWRARGSQPGA